MHRYRIYTQGDTYMEVHTDLKVHTFDSEDRERHKHKIGIWRHIDTQTQT